MIYVSNVKKNWGVIDFVLERTCAEEDSKSEKNGLH